MRNFGCTAVGGPEWDEVEKKKRRMEWERGVQGRLECSAYWQEEKRGFVVDACMAQVDWRVLLQERLPLGKWDEDEVPLLGFQTLLHLKSFLLGSSLAPEESRRGLKRGSRKSKWVNKSGRWKRRLNEQVNSDRRGKVGSDLVRGRVSSGRLAPILGKGRVNIPRRSALLLLLLLLLGPLSTA